MRNLACILVILGCAHFALAQQSDCGNVQMFESKLPVYPPIARAAHMQGVFRYSVVIHPDGHSDVRFVVGPDRAAFQVFEAGAREFIKSRKYGWATRDEHRTCNYTAEVEYRILPEGDAEPNNFMRVTDIDLSHTLVEVKTTTRTTVNY